MSDISVNNSHAHRTSSVGRKNPPSGKQLIRYTVTPDDIAGATSSDVINKLENQIRASHPEAKIAFTGHTLSPGKFGAGSVITLYGITNQGAPAPKKTTPKPTGAQPIQHIAPVGHLTKDDECAITFIKSFGIGPDEATTILNIVKKSCQASGVDVWDALALIAVETKFDRHAFNKSSHCAGIMQLNYYTAIDGGIPKHKLTPNASPQRRPAGKSFEEYDARYKPDEAIPAGIRYLATNCKYKRDGYKAIARYNFGPYVTNTNRLKETDEELYSNNETRGHTVKFLECRNALRRHDFSGAHDAAVQDNNIAAAKFPIKTAIIASNP